MNTLRTLVVVAVVTLSPASRAAEVFLSHYEPLRGVTLRAAESATEEAINRAATPAALSFEALGTRFDLDLIANDRVMDALPSGPAFGGIAAYRGQLAGNPDSWVRIVTFNGTPRGVVWDGETMYAIEAPGDSAAHSDELVIYRLADLNIVPGTMSCGTTMLSGNAAKLYASLEGDWTAAVSQAPGAVSEITVGVLGDASFTSAQGGDAAAAAAITARFNNIDGIFSEQVGVQLDVQRIDTFDSATDPFDNTLDAGTLLDQVSEHRLQTPAQNGLGLTHLYTGRNFDTSTVGVAWRGALCDNYFSAGLSEGRAGLMTDSLIAAHEIGHNFGAEHDGEPGSSCESEPDNAYIMAPSVNGSQQFSACSIGVMQAEAARASCVSALPAVDVGIRRTNPASTVLLGASTAIDYEVSANGTLAVANVVADFVVPNVLSLDAITASSGSCTSGAGTASCTFGDLAGLSSHTVTITTTAVAVGAGTLSASVTTSDADERSANDQDAAQLTVNPAVDLAVGTPSTSPAHVATSTAVTIGIDNLSTLQASNVALTVSLGSGLQADSASWSIGGCAVSAQQIDCQAGSFDAQSSTSLSITATALSTGTHDVSVSVSSAEADANTTNNSASGSVRVVEPQSEDSGGGAPSVLVLLAMALAALFRAARQQK